MTLFLPFAVIIFPMAGESPIVGTWKWHSMSKSNMARFGEDPQKYKRNIRE